MKDKEKQIEEMAWVIQEGCNNGCGCVTCAFNNYSKSNKVYHKWLECESVERATTIYNAGYRKIDKDSVVLSREEKQEFDVLVKLLTYDKPVKSRVFDVVKDIKTQASKETAEKIYRELQGHGTTYVKKWIKEQYGVEL